MKISDIKQGVTLYIVTVPLNSRPFLGVGVAAGRPDKSQFVRVRYPARVCGIVSVAPWYEKLNLLDFKGNEYNLNKIFSTRNAANRYLTRVSNNCLTHREISVKSKMLYYSHKTFILLPYTPVPTKFHMDYTVLINPLKSVDRINMSDL